MPDSAVCPFDAYWLRAVSTEAETAEVIFFAKKLQNIHIKILEEIMLATFVRVIIIYILVLIVMRLMGKREIGQLQPFELVIAIMIADLAAVPMADIGIPISSGIIPILGLLVMHLTISIINLKWVKARGFISGKPSILIFRGKIDEKQLKKERFTINELQERLRGNNVASLADVEYAILETNGEITVIQKPDKRATIPADFNIMPEYEGIPYDLVIDRKSYA